MAVTFHSSLNYINQLLHECSDFEDILLLSVNCYGRILIHFSESSLTRMQIVKLMEKCKISDYKVCYSDMFNCYYVSFKPPENSVPF